MEQIPQAKLPQLSNEEKKKFCDMVKLFTRVVFQSHDFGTNHPLVKASIEGCFKILDGLLQEKGRILLFIAEKKFKYADTMLEEKNVMVDRLINLFSTIQLVSFEFEKGFSLEDFLNLLNILSLRTQDILAKGGVEKLVNEKKINYLKLNPVKYELVGIGERIVSEETKVIEGLDTETEKELTDWLEKQKNLEKENNDEESEEDNKKHELEKLLSLINGFIKEGTEPSIFVEKITKEPLDGARLIVEAIHIANKSGGEEGKSIISSINNKLNCFRDNLYELLSEGKEDEPAKQIYKSAEAFGKELSRQLKTISVPSDLAAINEEMDIVLTMVMDQVEAQKLLSTFLKGEMTTKKKAAFFKKVLQRQKISTDFEAMMKKMLLLKGLPEDEVKRLFDNRNAILEEIEQEREFQISSGLKPTLERLLQNEIKPDEAILKLNDIVSNLVDEKIKSTTRKLQKDNEMLTAQTQIFNTAFGDIDEGIVVFDAEGRILFINKPASQLLGLKTSDKINAQILPLIINWQSKYFSLQDFLNENKINEDSIGQCDKIISYFKAIRKSTDERLNIAVFKPFA